MDETCIDAAPTPAHVFAYRAFRRAFVGSPSTSPVRPAEVEHNNKENARVSPIRGSRFVTAPVNSKRDAELGLENLSLTPKRQRTNPVSPTKSILKKTPAALTPRKAGLRDVTVTFKDVRLSVSPELARRGSPTRVRSQPDLRNTLAALSSVPLPRNSSAGQIEVHAKTQNPVNIPRPSSDDDFLAAYTAQTEKEMRRLIKYGQKWREYAKKQENENQKLRALLEEVQKENERLRQKSIASSKTSQRDATAPLPNPRTDGIMYDTAEHSIMKQRGSLRREAEKWKVPLENVEANVRQSKRLSAGNKPVTDMEGSNAAKSLRIQKGGFDFGTTPRTKADEVSGKQNLVRATSQQHVEKADPETQPRWTSSFTRPDIRTFDGNDIPLPNTTSEEKPEEDRKAAARERLRLRREAKAVNVSAPLTSGGTKAAKVSRESSKLDNEESQVDWMAMV